MPAGFAGPMAGTVTGGKAGCSGAPGLADGMAGLSGVTNGAAGGWR